MDSIILCKNPRVCAQGKWSPNLDRLIRGVAHVTAEIKKRDKVEEVCLTAPDWVLEFSNYEIPDSISESSMYDIFLQMVEIGYIERFEDGDDGRCALYKITQRGFDCAGCRRGHRENKIRVF